MALVSVYDAIELYDRIDEKMKNSQRISILGLVKFIAAVAIVYYHMVEITTDHWGSLFLLVELFFFITGYFTYKHFNKRKASQSLNNKAKEAITYTIRKIRPLAPYIVIAIILHSIVMSILALRGNTTKSSLLDVAIEAIMDVLLLGSQINVNGWALWFMSAMIIVLPLFCIICQYKQKYVHLIIFLLIAILFYFNIPSLDNIYGIWAIIRAFVGLCTGAAIYIIADQINVKQISSGIVGLLWSILDVALLAGAFLMMYPTRNSLNSRQCQSLAILLMALFLMLTMSKRTPLSSMSSEAMNYLEKASMVLFFTHQPIIQIVLFLYGPLNTIALRILMIVGCVVVSLLSYSLVSILSAHLQKNEKVSATQQ